MKFVSADEYAEVLNLYFPENTLLAVDRQPRFPYPLKHVLEPLQMLLVRLRDDYNVI